MSMLSNLFHSTFQRMINNSFSEVAKRDLSLRFMNSVLDMIYTSDENKNLIGSDTKEYCKLIIDSQGGAYIEPSELEAGFKYAVENSNSHHEIDVVHLIFSINLWMDSVSPWYHVTAVVEQFSRIFNFNFDIELQKRLIKEFNTLFGTE